MRAAPTRSIDLNADLGEHDGGGYDRDESLLDSVTSASIACGAHGGSRDVMQRTVTAARDRGVSVGAHPGYPDREGFGRREIGMPLDDIIDSMQEQIELLAECCRAAGTRLAYVKPHGALYNRAVKDGELARAIAARVAAIDCGLTILAPGRSAMSRAARARRLGVAEEAFVDRAYSSDGTLVPRSSPGAVLHDATAAAERAVMMVSDGRVRSAEGAWVQLAPRSLCVHGDNPEAPGIIRIVRQHLEEAGYSIAPFAR